SARIRRGAGERDRPRRGPPRRSELRSRTFLRLPRAARLPYARQGPDARPAARRVPHLVWPPCRVAEGRTLGGLLRLHLPEDREAALHGGGGPASPAWRGGAPAGGGDARGGPGGPRPRLLRTDGCRWDRSPEPPSGGLH